MFKENVKFLREMQSKTQEEFARKFGYRSAAAVCQWERGTSVPPANVLSRLAEMADVTVDELLNADISASLEKRKHDTDMRAAVRIKVYSSIHAGIPDEAIDEVVDWEDIPAEWTTNGRKYYGVRVKGDSMEPDYREGDTIIVQSLPQCESGDTCVVRVNGDDAVLRKVIIHEDKMILQPLNPAYQPMFFTGAEGEPHVEIGGIVRELRRTLK